MSGYVDSQGTKYCDSCGEPLAADAGWQLPYLDGGTEVPYCGDCLTAAFCRTLGLPLVYASQERVNDLLRRLIEPDRRPADQRPVPRLRQQEPWPGGIGCP